jgi:hypothetical protein
MAVMVALVLMIAGGAIIQNKHPGERAWCNEHANECVVGPADNASNCSRSPSRCNQRPPYSPDK